MDKKWWKEGVVYQVYPRSFKDSNNDGIGDICGVTEKLDYLKYLGVDIIWLSPIFKSPNDDNGYDISDYRDIMDEFGSMEDFKILLDTAHKKGFKLILDLVVNHTSDEHEWFKKSVKRIEPYTDYYIWRDVQNNWESHFSGTAWDYNEERGQYYLHLFTKKQPDLNWENPLVRQEVYDIMNFWFDIGIDGFRMDTVNMYSKVPGFPSMEKEGLSLATPYFLNGPRIHEYLHGMYVNSLCKYDVMSVGEAPQVDPEMALLYVGKDRQELNMIIHFDHMFADDPPEGAGKWERRPTDLNKVRDVFVKWQKGLAKDGWNCLYMSNHDQPRQASRFANDQYKNGATMLATMLHTLKGTPFIYQGEELGMKNAYFKNEWDYRDVETINSIAENKVKGIPFEALRENLGKYSRDNARTPMHWDNSMYMGFSQAPTWIGINENCRDINVEAQTADADSVLNYYKKLIALRKTHDVLIYGDFEEIELGEDLFCYTRTLNDKKAYILLNLACNQTKVTLPDTFDITAPCIISNCNITIKKEMNLPPYFATVLLSDG